MNKKPASRIISVIFSFLIITSPFANSSLDMSPVGIWTTLSDEDNKPRSVVEIINYRGQIKGKILKVYSKPDDHDYCIHCSGKNKNKPIIGMTIMKDLKPDGKLAWSGGSILDPKNGKIYKCKIELEASGKKLFVRGYIGISLFGRTQTWIRRESN